jgi:transposase
MPNKRLTMRHIKEIRRLKLEAKLSHRQTARNLGIGEATVSTYGKRAAVLGLYWPLLAEMSDNDLEQLLFPSPQLSARHGRVMPDCAAIHLELKRKGVTKQLL